MPTAKKKPAAAKKKPAAKQRLRVPPRSVGVRGKVLRASKAVRDLHLGSYDQKVYYAAIDNAAVFAIDEKAVKWATDKQQKALLRKGFPLRRARISRIWHTTIRAIPQAVLSAGGKTLLAHLTSKQPGEAFWFLLGA